MFDLTLPALIHQTRVDVKAATAEHWERFDVFEHIERYYEKYVGTRITLTAKSKPWSSMADTFIAMCLRERVDPEVWLESQLCLLSEFFKKPGSRIYPKMLLGKNAVIRYEKYREHNKRHFKNVKQRHDTTRQEIIQAETEYGENVVRCIATYGREAYSRDYRIRLSTSIKEAYPAWSTKNPQRSAVRPQALVNVLGSYHHDFPSCVRLKRDFKWSEIATFILEQSPK